MADEFPQILAEPDKIERKIGLKGRDRKRDHSCEFRAKFFWSHFSTGLKHHGRGAMSPLGKREI
jgi:hypothetical protein